jgi:hypothetical protein
MALLQWNVAWKLSKTPKPWNHKNVAQLAICDRSPFGPPAAAASLPSSYSQQFPHLRLTKLTPICSNNVHSALAWTSKSTHKCQIITENKADTHQCILKLLTQLSPPSEDLTCYTDRRWQCDAVKSGALKSKKQTWRQSSREQVKLSLHMPWGT